MVLEDYLFTTRVLISIALAVAFTLAVYYGAKTVIKFRGEFGVGVGWITFGFTLLLVTQIISPFYPLFSEASTERITTTILTSALAVGACSMIIYGYKKISDLISAIT